MIYEILKRIDAKEQQLLCIIGFGSQYEVIVETETTITIATLYPLNLGELPKLAPIRHVRSGTVLVDDSVLLGDIKQEARQRINAARDIAEQSGFIAFDRVFDSDAVSLQRISLVVQAALSLGETFSIEWTCKDNSKILLTQAMLIQIPAIIAGHGDALHKRARTLKDQIDAATTIEEVNAVVW